MNSNLRKYIGIPFVDRQSSFEGADCFGLLRLFYQHEFGYLIPDPFLPCRAKNSIFARYEKEIAENWKTLETPEDFCVVAMAHDVNTPHLIQHFGILLPNKKLLHTLEKVGSHTVGVKSYKWAIKGFHKWRI